MSRIIPSNKEFEREARTRRVLFRIGFIVRPILIALAIAGFRATSSYVGRAVLLTLSFYMLAGVLVRLVPRHLGLNSRHYFLFSQAIAQITLTVFLFLGTPSTFRLVLAWIVLTSAAPLLLKTFVVIGFDIRSTRYLLSCYANDQQLPLRPAVVYILTHPRVDIRTQFNKLRKQISSGLHSRLALLAQSRTEQSGPRSAEDGRSTLWEHLRPVREHVSTTLSQIHGHRGAWCLTSASLGLTGTGNLSFHEWLVREAAGVIIVRHPSGGSVLADASLDFQVPSFRHLEAKACELAEGPILTVDYGSYAQAALLGQAPQSTAPFFVHFPYYFDLPDIRGTAASISETIAGTLWRVRCSDSQLPSALREATQSVLSSAPLPLALAYLRFRCAKSDVERLLCLLDCIETLIKLSASILLADHWRAMGNDVNIGEFLARPSLGQWIGALRSFVTSKATPTSGYASIMRSFWKLPLRNPQTRLIDDARGSGLALGGKIPRTHLGWVDWLANFRNETKGHGVLDDRVAAPLWHGFHETFLSMVQALGPILLQSNLTFGEPPENADALNGCANYRMQQYFGLKPEASSRPTPLYIQGISGVTLPRLALFPLLLWYGNSVWLWNKAEKNLVEYIDYGTGQLKKLDVGGTDPCDLWRRHGANVATGAAT